MRERVERELREAGGHVCVWTVPIGEVRAAYQGQW